MEGDITEFPSIKDKIANMEDVGKSVGQFFVPDVKSKMRTGAPPAAGWMEARTKLQSQLDSLIAKTSAKMSKYGTVHAIEPREVTKAEEKSPEEGNDPEPRKKQPISPALTSLIKSVANEIQKSFSSKSLANCDNEEDEDKEDEVENDLCDENNNNVDNNDEYWRNDQSSKQRQPQIDMEAPIDFDYDEPASNNCDPEVLMEEIAEEIEEENVEEVKEEETEVEEPLEQTEASDEHVSSPLVLDASLARSKVKLMRKTERRLPAHVLAKRRAAEKLREPEQLRVMEQIKKELTDASQQVDLSDHDHDLENLNDDEKVDLIAKQMSKMESGYIMKLLKQLESGILDISVPMLLPFLSLQVKLDLGRNIFKSLEPQSKVKVVKENFISDMINDITDIALLQEVIDRTQEKINLLCPPVLSVMPGDYYSIENDSYELPSHHATPRSLESPARGTTGLTEVLSHLEKLMKEGSRAQQENAELQREEVPANSSQPTSSKLEEEKSSDETDEGLPGSECYTSSEEEKEDLIVKEKVVIISEKKQEIEKEESIEKKIEEEEKTEKKVESKRDSSPVKEKLDSKESLAATGSDISPVSPPKENNETVIKHKLRNILQNCKTNEETRPVRNFGRNFEFQNVQLKPVLPNDKRPAKARRMDDMWMNSISSKQKWPCNNELSAPKPKVPWTRNKNTQPQKKEENTDVKEFEKCHKNLKDVECKQISTVKEVIQNSTKIDEKTIRPSEDDCKVQTKEENKKDSEDKKTEKVPSDVKTEVEVEKENIKEREEKTENREEAIQLEKKEIKIEDVAENSSVVVKEQPAVEAKSSVAKETSKYKQPQIDVEAPIDFGDVDTSHLQKDLLDVPSTKVKSSKTDVTSKDEEEKTPLIKKSGGGEASKDTVSVPSTPTVRRRGDTFTVVLPLREKPPPPPVARPPPPPMSPPVPVERVEQLEKEEKIGKIDKKIETQTEESEESDEESEWEWTEESEEEEEEEGNTYEVNKEGWQNIMSTSKGPTTYKAEYSIKVGGK